MPSKSRKAASRQAKLRDRKRHGKAASQVFEVGPTKSEKLADDSAGEEEPRPQQATSRPTLGGVQPRAARRPSQIQDAEEAPRYEYLGGELRRIGIATLGIAVLLVAASFVLGG